MANQSVGREAKEGIGFGLIAGIIFAIMESVGAAMMGNPPLMPFRLFASVVLGQSAMDATSIGTVFVVGVLAHLGLSAVFGLIYGLINSQLSTETQTNWGREVGLGLLFGACLWLVNFQVVARLFYPWFLTAPQFLQMMMHAVFFGLPLSLMFAGAERRVHHIRRAPTSARV